jgi:hypothetical protein
VNTGGQPPVWSGGPTVGDTNWTTGIEPGWVSSNLNVQIPNPPPVPNPSGGWWGMPTVSNNVYVFSGSGPGTTNYYRIPAGQTQSAHDVYLITNGPVVLDFAGSFAGSGQFVIDIATNSSLTGYLNGDFSDSGGGIVNEGQIPANCIFAGEPGCNNILMSGGTTQYGVIDAPNSNVDLQGGDSFYGAIIANTFEDGGGVTLHYDSALAQVEKQIYVVSSYQEVH